jgi:hypothetical protein
MASEPELESTSTDDICLGIPLTCSVSMNKSWNSDQLSGRSETSDIASDVNDFIYPWRQCFIFCYSQTCLCVQKKEGFPFWKYFVRNETDKILIFTFVKNTSIYSGGLASQ